MTITKDEVYTAYREAGHAVVHEAVGLHVEWIDLDFKDGAKTRTADYYFHSGLPDEHLGIYLATVAAGPMTEMIYRTTDNTLNYYSDETRAWLGDHAQITNMQEIVGSPERFDRLLPVAQRLILELLHKHWPAIEAMATELRRQRRLAGWEVRRIIFFAPSSADAKEGIQYKLIE